MHLVGCTLRITWAVYVTPSGSEALVLYSLTVAFPVSLPYEKLSLHSSCRINHGFAKERLQVCNLAESSCLKEGGKGGLIKQMRWSELNWTVSGSLPEVGFVISSDEPLFPVTKCARDSIWYGWVARQSEIQVYIDLVSFEDIYAFNRAWIRLRVKHCREFFCCPASRCIRVMKTNLMHYLFPVYFVNQPLHVSGIFVAHHQEVHCIYTTIGTCCAF